MKELLTAVKTHLQADDNLSFIDDANILITPDVDIIPVAMNFPGLTIKDGDIRRTVITNNDWEIRYTVLIAIFQLLKQGDISIIGQSVPRVYGVLEIADLLHLSLNGELLGISGMEMAFAGEIETETEMIGYEKSDLVLQRKIISYEYQKLQARP